MNPAGLGFSMSLRLVADEPYIRRYWHSSSSMTWSLTPRGHEVSYKSSGLGSFVDVEIIS